MLTGDNFWWKNCLKAVLLPKINENTRFPMCHAQNKAQSIIQLSYGTWKFLTNTYFHFKIMYLTGNLQNFDKLTHKNRLSFSIFQTLSYKNYWDLSLEMLQLTCFEFITPKVPIDTKTRKNSHSQLFQQHAATMCGDFSKK